MFCLDVSYQSNKRCPFCLFASFISAKSISEFRTWGPVCKEVAFVSEKENITH